MLESATIFLSELSGSFLRRLQYYYHEGVITYVRGGQIFKSGIELIIGNFAGVNFIPVYAAHNYGLFMVLYRSDF